MLSAFVESVREHDAISPARLGERLHMPVARLARLARLHRNTLSLNPDSPAAQERLGEIARIVAEAADLAGDEGRAIVWFRHQPLPGFGGETAEELVGQGHAAAVIHYLAGLRDGVYA